MSAEYRAILPATWPVLLVGALRLAGMLHPGSNDRRSVNPFPRGYDDWQEVDLRLVGRHKLTGLFQTMDMVV